MEASTSSSDHFIGPAVAKPIRGTFQDRSQYKQWDFLTGAGPSSAAMYYVEDKPSWKPGWKALRREGDIKQDEQRIKDDAFREQRREGGGKVRTEHLQQWNSYNRFNPITGQALDAGTGQWAPASEPWQHQKLGLKPVPGYHNGKVQDAASQPEQRKQAILDMRKERIASDGLFHSKRVGGSVKELMQWQ